MPSGSSRLVDMTAFLPTRRCNEILSPHGQLPSLIFHQLFSKFHFHHDHDTKTRGNSLRLLPKEVRHEFTPSVMINADETRKRRCDGNIPCKLCHDTGEECRYPILPTARDGAPLEPRTSACTQTERLAKVEASLERHGLLLHDIQAQLTRLHSSTSASLAATSPSFRSMQTCDSFPPHVENNAIEDVHFLIPEKHSTSTTWLLSHPTIRRLLGEYPERYFHALEKSDALLLGQSGKDGTVSPLLDGEGEAELLARQYFSGPHQHYPIFAREELTGLLLEAQRDGTGSLAGATVQLVHALSKEVLPSKLSQRESTESSKYERITC